MKQALRIAVTVISMLVGSAGIFGVIGAVIYLTGPRIGPAERGALIGLLAVIAIGLAACGLRWVDATSPNSSKAPSGRPQAPLSLRFVGGLLVCGGMVASMWALVLFTKIALQHGNDRSAVHRVIASVEVLSLGVFFAGAFAIFCGGAMRSTSHDAEHEILDTLLSGNAGSYLPASRKTWWKNFWALVAIGTAILSLFAGLQLVAVFALIFALTTIWMLVHESGHLLAAYLAGFQPRHFRVGNGPVILNRSIGGVAVEWRLFPTGGWLHASPVMRSNYRERYFALVAGGPAADLVSISVLWLLLFQYAHLSTVLVEVAGAFALFLILLLMFACPPNVGFVFGRRLPSDSWWLANIFRLPISMMEMHFDGSEQAVLTSIEKPTNQMQIASSSTAVNPASSEESISDAILAERHRDWPLAESRLRHALSCRTTPDRWIPSLFARWLVALVGVGKPKEVRAEIMALLHPPAPSDLPGLQLLGSELWAQLGKPSELLFLLDQLACLPLMDGHLEYLPDAREWIGLARQRAPDVITLRGTEGSLLVEAGEVESGVRILEEVRRTSESTVDLGICALYLAIAQRKQNAKADVSGLLAEARALAPQRWLMERVTALETAMLPPSTVPPP